MDEEEETITEEQGEQGEQELELEELEELEEQEEHEEEEEQEEQEEHEESVDYCDEFEKQENEKRAIEEKQKESEKPIPLVLEPDHPMMEKFQASLKSHLLRQLDKLSNQVYEMENEIKKREHEKEETGVTLYAMQQEVYKQQKTLEDCDSAIENLMKERENLDESLRSKKLCWKEKVDCLNSLKKKESDMKAEFSKLSTLEQQMEKWEKEMESELTISQRISEKTQYDKNKMIEEKRKMDMYLLRLMTAVSNFETEMRFLEGEIDMKMEEKDTLNQTLADAAADLQCLITEQKRLTSAWNSVISTISQRNAVYLKISKELEKCQEGFRSLNAEIESYKRSSAEEMKKGEKLAMIYGRLQHDSESANLIFKNLMEKKMEIENKISGIVGMINRTEAELQHTKIEQEKYYSTLCILRKEIEKITSEKRQAQENTMNLIQEQFLNDKTASCISRLIKEARERTRKQEFSLIEKENSISKKFLEIEELKEVINRNNDIINEMNTKLNTKEEELKKYKDDIAKNQGAIIQKQGNYAGIIRRIEKAMEKSNHGKLHASPLQQRIVELEKLNAEVQAKNEKMQSFWLLQQSNNMKLTQQRRKQLKDISILRKQVLLLEQKALKIENEFDKEKRIEHNLNKSINQLQYKFTILNETLVGKKDYQENLDRENIRSQNLYLQDLKDAELKQIRLKAEVKELETNLEELAEVMLSIQREMLAWEKKIQSAVEAKNDMQKERAGGGEIGQMKAEIHRMEVRYGQLKRVQEKLITDLEQCVLRRDAICEVADALEKRQARGGFNTRFTIQKKINTIKNNIRLVCNEQRQTQKLIDNMEEGHKELKNNILQKEEQLLQMQETTKKMDLQLEEGKLQKIQNLEMLIRRQKKCKLYELVRNGKHKLLFKTEELIENQLQKLRSTNNDIISVIEALIENFPAYRFQWKKIINTLKAKPS